MMVTVVLIVAVLVVGACGLPTAQLSHKSNQCSNATLVRCPSCPTQTVTHPSDFIGPVSFLQTGETPKSIPIQQKFQVECQCTEQVRIPSNNKLPMEIPFGVCAANEVLIANKESGSGMSAADVRTAIGNPLKVKWAKVLYHHFSDFEGRTSAQVIGLPGGDLAEFMNALDVFEEMTNTYVTDADCSRLLRRYLGYTKKVSFYMMTDTAAVTQLSSNVDIDNLDLRETPDGGQRGKLLDALVLPEHNGCKFIRSMLTSPEDYDVRRGLPECAIRAFFQILWDKNTPEGKKLRLVELDGVGAEKAVVLIKTSAECTNQGIAPLVQPMSSDHAMFVVHEAAADVYRMELSEFMADLDEKVDAARMRDSMNANGEKYLNRAIKAFAVGKPVFEATIS